MSTMQPTLHMALRAVRSAGEMIYRAYERREHADIQSKGVHDYVTATDRKVEQFIREQLRATYPEHGFIGEEFGHDGSERESVWILDPIDGTTNFIHGFPQFAISLALQVRGHTELAIVFDPLRREEFTALRGGGARLGNHRLRLPACKGLNDALIGTGFPFRPDQMPDMDDYLRVFRQVAEHSAGIRRAGAASLDLAYVAAGRLNGFWENGLSLWDMAAGDLLIREAGGLVTDFQGGHDYLRSGRIVAGHSKVVKSLLTLIHGNELPL